MASSSRVVTPGRTAARICSCISATTRPARRMCAISSGVRCTDVERAIFTGGSSDRGPGVHGVDQALEHLVGLALAVDLDQQAPLGEQRDGGDRVALVGLEPLVDGLGGVVGPLHDLAAALVAGPG